MNKSKEIAIFAIERNSKTFTQKNSGIPDQISILHRVSICGGQRVDLDGDVSSVPSLCSSDQNDLERNHLLSAFCGRTSRTVFDRLMDSAAAFAFYRKTRTGDRCGLSRKFTHFSAVFGYRSFQLVPFPYQYPHAGTLLFSGGI